MISVGIPKNNIDKYNLIIGCRLGKSRLQCRLVYTSNNNVTNTSSSSSFNITKLMTKIVKDEQVYHRCARVFYPYGRLAK